MRWKWAKNMDFKSLTFLQYQVLRGALRQYRQAATGRVLGDNLRPENLKKWEEMNDECQLLLEELDKSRSPLDLFGRVSLSGLQTLLDKAVFNHALVALVAPTIPEGMALLAKDNMALMRGRGSIVPNTCYWSNINGGSRIVVKQPEDGRKWHRMVDLVVCVEVDKWPISDLDTYLHYLLGNRFC